MWYLVSSIQLALLSMSHPPFACSVTTSKKFCAHTTITLTNTTLSPTARIPYACFPLPSAASSFSVPPTSLAKTQAAKTHSIDTRHLCVRTSLSQSNYLRLKSSLRSILMSFDTQCINIASINTFFCAKTMPKTRKKTHYLTQAT